jgi:hypothetical protein
MVRWAQAVVAFCILVGLPGVVQYTLIPRLRREHIDRRDPPKMSARFWRWSDANRDNYTDHGKQLLRLYELMQFLQVVLAAAWASVFVL